MPHGITLGQLYASDQWLEMLKDVSDVSEEFVELLGGDIGGNKNTN